MDELRLSAAQPVDGPMQVGVRGLQRGQRAAQVLVALGEIVLAAAQPLGDVPAQKGQQREAIEQEESPDDLLGDPARPGERDGGGGCNQGDEQAADASAPAAATSRSTNRRRRPPTT
jgi:hypothetical protein